MVSFRTFSTTLLIVSGLQLSAVAKADVVVPNGFFLAQLVTNYPTPSNPRHFQNGTFAPVDDTLTLNTGLTSGQINSVVSTHPGFNATASVNGTGGQMIAMGNGGYYFAVAGAAGAQAHILLAGSGGVGTVGQADELTRRAVASAVLRGQAEVTRRSGHGHETRA